MDKVDKPFTRRRKSSNLVDIHILVPADIHTYLHKISPSPGDFSKIVRAVLTEYVVKARKKEQEVTEAIAAAKENG